MGTTEPLMQTGRDVCWVLAGRTESNLPKAKRILRKYSLAFETFYLCYNTKLMQQYGYWQRIRGIANSKSMEILLLVYKGRVPKHMPKKRMYVDPGSYLFNQVVRNVPVLCPKNQAYVSRSVRETSLSTMAGTAHDEDETEKKKLIQSQQQGDDDDPPQGLHQPGDGANEQQKAMVVASVKKRKLYRQVSGTDVPWFPHDNAIELLKELCWEADRPRWVFLGTPAGGAGILGSLEMGASVVALCYDEHHRLHLEKCVLERAVEAMVSGASMVFKDDALQARSSQLNLTSLPKPAKEESDPDQDDQGRKKKKKAKKGTAKAKAKRAKKTNPKGKEEKESDSSSSESSTASTSDDDESESQPPSKKKAKKM